MMRRLRSIPSAALIAGAALVLTLPANSLRAQGPIRGHDAQVIAKINELLAQSWKDNQVTPSPAASETAWIRRAYLDVVGHIPPAEVVQEFVKNSPKTDQERNARLSEVVEDLLASPAYARNWATIWTNLSIGRITPRKTSRFGMKRFYRKAFATNRPWNEIVYDLLSATGAYEKNGAVNYLLGQMTMNDNRVLATAKTTRLFLGVQVQCTQCHNHPFNDWTQETFWQYNSFFQDAKRVDHQEYDPDSGMMIDTYSEIVHVGAKGPVYFERRNGLMEVAYPTYEGRRIDDAPDVDRMTKLAEMICHSDDRQLARSFVNRMWAHFFAFGFTRPVDDMGPHNPANHSKLLDYLTKQFVEDGYDIKALIRWIVSSDAYHLSSQITPENEFDKPSAGATPLFSHMYLKRMNAEQLYNSLIIATEANKSGGASWREAEQQRQKWLRQFVRAFGTDEGGESSTFNGTIPQALMMMNGELIQNATNCEPGSFLYDVLHNSASPRQAIETLYLATLGRMPKKRELAAATKLFAASPDSMAGYQDLFWALLNSNEFIFIK